MSTSISLPTEVTWLLDEGFFGYVGTSGAAGVPHVTPVIFVYRGRNIFFLTSKTTRKVKDIRENSKVAFLIDIRDPVDPHNNRAVLIQGKAKVYGPIDTLLHLPLVVKLRRLFTEKYPKYVKAYRSERAKLPEAWRTTLLRRRLLVRVDMEKIAYIRGARLIWRLR